MDPHRARIPTLVAAVLVLLVGLGCTGVVDTFLPQPDAQSLEQAHQQLADGQLPEARASFAALHAQFPRSVEVASALAYVQVLAGRPDEADQVLAGVRQSSEVVLRRALVAKRRAALDDVREYGLSSGTLAGKLFAAEVMIVDLELERALTTLGEVAATDGVEGATARNYLALLQHEDPRLRALANPVALWSVGKHRDACEGADRVLRKLDADAQRSEQLLLWAGRAVTVGLPRIARSMVEEAVSLPREQSWRAQATLATVEIAEGDNVAGLRIFEALRSAKSGAPIDGVDDARVTACALARDPATAARLVEGLESPGAARCLLAAGAIDAARERPSAPALGRLLENL